MAHDGLLVVALALMPHEASGNQLRLHFPGDPTLLGWLTTVAYAVAAILCWMAVRAAAVRTGPGSPADRRGFWLAVMLLVAALGLNKQLDLQIIVQWLGRQLIAREDWQDYRPLLRTGLFIAVGVTLTAMFIGFIWLARRVWRDCGLALFGLGLLVGFVLLRVAFFEKMDDFVGRSLAAGRVKWVLELGGIVCIAVSAARHARNRSLGPVNRT